MFCKKGKISYKFKADNKVDTDLNGVFRRRTNIEQAIA